MLSAPANSELGKIAKLELIIATLQAKLKNDEKGEKTVRKRTTKYRQKPKHSVI